MQFQLNESKRCSLQTQWRILFINPTQTSVRQASLLPLILESENIEMFAGFYFIGVALGSGRVTWFFAFTSAHCSLPHDSKPSISMTERYQISGIHKSSSHCRFHASWICKFFAEQGRKKICVRISRSPPSCCSSNLRSEPPFRSPFCHRGPYIHKAHGWDQFHPFVPILIVEDNIDRREKGMTLPVTCEFLSTKIRNSICEMCDFTFDFTNLFVYLLQIFISVNLIIFITCFCYLNSQFQTLYI